MFYVSTLQYAVLSGGSDRLSGLLKYRAFDEHHRTLNVKKDYVHVVYLEPVARMIYEFGKESLPRGVEIRTKCLISNNCDMKKKNTYALYRGDELLSFGTLEEIAHDMNVSVKTVLHYGIPSWKKRENTNWYSTRVLVKVEDDGEEEEVTEDER